MLFPLMAGLLLGFSAVAASDVQADFQAGVAAAEKGSLETAIASFTKVLDANPSYAPAWQQRGSAHFRSGQIKQSVHDFDQFLKLRPDQAPQHWQRGISLYYAGQFEEGTKQFELHRKVNPHDVENAVWHFLCLSKLKNFEEARKQIIPVEADARVPMAEIHQLFSGTKKPAEVLEAVEKGNPSAAQKKDRLFYAHLYLGLYFEALGERTKSAEHIKKAAVDYYSAHYMGDVAKIHMKLRSGI